MPKKKLSAHAFPQHVWRHNSFMGMARMMEMNANTILTAPSTSSAAKVTAKLIKDLAILLDKQLRTERIDP